MATNYSPKIVTDGLVLCLDAANLKSYPGSGTTWYDLSRNGNHAILYNSPTFSTSNLGELLFDGSNDYAASSSFFLNSDPLLSVCMFIKRTGSFSAGGYWGLGGGNFSNGINAYAYPGRSNKIGWDLWGRSTFDTSQNYPFNEWVYVCWTKVALGFTISSLKVYINAKEFPLNYIARNNSSSVNILDGFALGRISDNSNRYYAPGFIGLTKLYNRALTEAEIKQNFEATRDRYGI